jgi:hypothetical protein
MSEDGASEVKGRLHNMAPWFIRLGPLVVSALYQSEPHSIHSPKSGSSTFHFLYVTEVLLHSVTERRKKAS